ncbi:MAG: 2-hydroxyacyl-CoA dehydratase [Promethearchaeota archaeon]|nr:MAG: 2-hydroxyacyl-CoA dehydratase [Candidatus Lokiarchaeota archaeon]
MSLYADEIIRFSSVLKISYNLIAGRDELKRMKLREKKHLISVALPFSDLIYGFPNLVPVFPIRMHMFNISKYLSYLGSASNIFGWDNVSKFLGFVKNAGIEEISKIIDEIIDDVIETLNQKYNEMYDIGVERGISTDFCFALKTLVGMHVTKSKNVSATMNYSIRCSAWNKYLESLKSIDDSVKDIWLDIPPRNIGNSIELLQDNIRSVINELEKLSGHSYSDNTLREHFKTTNQIRRDYKTIIYDIGASDIIPCNPATFSEILALLSLSFQDYNSNAKRYAENIHQMVNEMRERIRKGLGMDVSKYHKIMVTPMFGGWEPKTHEIIYKLGGRALYADWDVLRFLEDIPISNRRDPIEAYAYFLADITENGIGCDNDILTDSYIRVAKNLGADGLVFNQLFGCHSVSNCYRLLKDKIRKDLEIPSMYYTFNRIGENVEQISTRLGAFMEMLQ